MIEPSFSVSLVGPPDGGRPGAPPDDNPPPDSPLARAASSGSQDTIEVNGQALDITASSEEESTGYTGAATYSSDGQPLTATGGLLDISG